MIDENPYRAPVSPEPVQRGQVSSNPGLHGWLRRLLHAVFVGLALGAMIGTVDIHIVDGGNVVDWAYFVSGLALGSIYGWYALVAWPPLAVSLFVVHVIALRFFGYRQPYVEKDAAHALFCLPVAALPSAAGLVIGAVVRSVVSLAARVFKGKPGSHRGGGADHNQDIDIIIDN